MITGGGGAGKTRLALEECERAEQAGWTAGLLSLDATATVDVALDRLVEWPGRLFLAIDYAETRPDVVGSLIGRLARLGGGPAVRLVLVCRQIGTREELKELFATGDDRDAIATPLREVRRVMLGDPEFRLDAKRLFEAGIATFGPLLGGDGNVPDVSLEAAHFARPLFVLAAALLCAADPSVDPDALNGEELMLELIDRHETQYWQRWNESRRAELDQSLHARSVALATLLGADTEAEALSLVGTIPGLEEASGERKLAVARWLSHLYARGRLDQAPAISPIEPDVLGEALVVRELTRQPDLMDKALDVATDTQLARALNVLSRAGATDEQLRERVGTALDARLSTLVERAAGSSSTSLDLALALERSVAMSRPRANAIEAARVARKEGPALAGVASALFRIAIDDLRDVGEDPARRNELARLLTGFSAALLDSYKWDEALVAVEEAVEIGEALVDEGHLEFRLSLADSRNNLADLLNRRGWGEQALPPIEAAVEVYEELAAEDPGRYLPSFSGSLITLSNALSGAGRNSEALGAIEESVDTYRKFAKGGPARYRAEFAQALNNFVDLLPQDRREKEALPLLEEAVELSRKLVELNRKPHLSVLARSLAHLAFVLFTFNSRESILPTIEEALDLQRELVGEGVRYHLDELAETLNLMAILSSNDPARSAELLEEAVGYYEELAIDDPYVYMPRLGIALDNFGKSMRNAGQSKRALAVIERELERAEEGNGVGFIWLSRAEWHADEGDAATAIEDWLMALERGEAEEMDWLCSEARTRLGQFRSKDQAAFDSAWRLVTTDEALPDWLVNWSMEAEDWEEISAASGDDHELAEELREWASLQMVKAIERLESDPGRLLDPRCEKMLRDEALENPYYFFFMGLLTLARLHGCTGVTTRVKELEMLEDYLCLDAEWKPETLAIARIWSSACLEDPSIQFQHALAAAMAGEEQEGEQAIDRCLQLLPPPERDEYLDRLEEVRAIDEGRSHSLQRLEGAFFESFSGDAGD